MERVSVLTVPAELLIRLYQKTISPWIPCCCRFTPSCSRYALEAYRRHGLWRGSWLTIWRLMRCQPFCRGGWDPVPPNKSEINNG